MSSSIPTLPTIRIGDCEVSRLIMGGNPFSGFSHVSTELDWEMISYYTMPRLQDTLDEAWRCGINTVVSRADRHIMRMMLEHRLNGGQMQWIAQTAGEFADISANIAEIARYKPIAIFHHGTYADNAWHRGEMATITDIVKIIKDAGLPAGIATHIPEVIEYAEEHEWETDFYAACFYDLARGYKSAPAVDQDAYRQDRFPDSDPARMTKVIRQASKPCLAYKILAASRKCGSDAELRATFKYAFDNIKPTDGVVVGVYQKYKNQVAQDAQVVRELLVD